MKKAIIIGASSGIGFEVAKLLINKGWKVGVAARRTELLLALKDIAPDRVETIGLDVNDDNATQKLRQFIDKTGGMSLFIYSSGIGKQNRDLCPDIEMAVMKTNVMGFTAMIGEAYRYFSETGKGHIAAITSVAGTKGIGAAPAYSASKAMQNTYIEALEQQANMRGLDISFTDIRPGFVDTDFIKGGEKYPFLMKTEKVAAKIVTAIENKKHVCVIDGKWNVITFVWKLIPKFIWRRMKL